MSDLDKRRAVGLALAAIIASVNFIHYSDSLPTVVQIQVARALRGELCPSPS